MKQLHNGISKGCVEMLDDLCAPAVDEPILSGRQVQLIVRCILPSKPATTALPLPHRIDYKFSGGLKPVVVSAFRPTVDGTSRSPKLWHRKSTRSCWASIAEAFFPRIPLKRNSVHPFSGESIADSRSALHTPQLMCQYLDYSAKCSTAMLASSSELVLEGHLGSQNLVRDVALALLEHHQQQPSMKAAGLGLQHFVYHPVSRTLCRTSQPALTSNTASEEVSPVRGAGSSSSSTAQSTSVAEVRGASTATATSTSAAGSFSTATNSAAPVVPSSSKRTARGSIVAIFKGGGYGSGKRDCAPAPAGGADTAAAEAALQKELDVYYAPEQQLFLVCEKTSVSDTLILGETDVFSTHLKDFLGLAEKCLSERIAGHVRELPIEY